MPATHNQRVDADLPLNALLSHALVAFTIEFDNEFERRLIEPTGETFKIWKREVFLVSLAMWANFLRFLADGEKPVAELARLGCCDGQRMKSVLNGFRRWRLVVVEPPADTGRKPPFGEWLVRPTSAGERCLSLWEPLPQAIEARWRSRFGDAAIDALRTQLADIVRRRALAAPQCLPILSSRREMHLELSNDDRSAVGDPERSPLFALLSQALLAFTMDFEAGHTLALPPCANGLRVLDGDGIPVRDLPRRSGVSKEGMAQVLNLLGRHDLATVEPLVEGRGKQARLTAHGLDAKASYLEHQSSIGLRWRTEFGGGLQESLRKIVVTRRLADSPLAEGLVPHPVTWRAEREPPEVLPDHPMVLGRGAWPDAS